MPGFVGCHLFELDLQFHKPELIGLLGTGAVVCRALLLHSRVEFKKQRQSD